MAMQPRIDQPCPLRFGAMPQPGADFCSRCERQVHNLDRLDAAARVAFLRACEGPVCVAYSVRRPLASLVAAASMAAAGAGMAQGLVSDALPQSPAAVSAPLSLPGSEAQTERQCEDGEIMEEEFFMGGVSKPGALEMVEVDDGLPALPQISEQELLDAAERPIASFVAPPSD